MTNISIIPATITLSDTQIALAVIGTLGSGAVAGILSIKKWGKQEQKKEDEDMALRETVNNLPCQKEGSVYMQTIVRMEQTVNNLPCVRDPNYLASIGQLKGIMQSMEGVYQRYAILYDQQAKEIAEINRKFDDFLLKCIPPK